MLPIIPGGGERETASRSGGFSGEGGRQAFRRFGAGKVDFFIFPVGRQ
jgi:hypothetical protein